MWSKHPCVWTCLKILACLVTAAIITLLIAFLIKDPDPQPTLPQPTPCPLDCKNGGICTNNRCYCPDNYTGELCTKENFCRSFQNCSNQECFTFGNILVGMYGYSEETCNASDVNANTSRAVVQCIVINGDPVLGVPKIQNCNQNLQTLANKTDIDAENVKEIAVTTQILTSEPETLQADDISNAIRIVNRILNATEEEEVVVSAVTTVSQLLSANVTVFGDETVAKEAESLTRSMETFSVNSSSDALSVVQPSVAVEKRQLSARNKNGVMFLSLRGLNEDDNLVSTRIIVDNDTSEFLLNRTAEVQLFIKPAENSDVDATVGFVLYQNDYLFPSDYKRTLKHKRRIISASISEGIYANVEFSFNQQFDSYYSLIQYACVFWDYERSEWNTTGCRKTTEIVSNETISNEITSLQCACDHTTNFAVLMKFKENIKYAPLDTVSTIGCALSMTGLSITVIFLLYVRFRSIHPEHAALARNKKPASWILISLCTSLLVFYIVFIAAMEISHIDTDNVTSNDSENELFFTDLGIIEDDVMCTALAVLQHYFLLTTFVLTTMLGSEFCIRFIWFTPSLPEHFMKSALLIGWGLPALIVLITFGATYPGTNGYNRKEFCWLVAENEKKQLDPAKPMLWSFLLPVGIILLANICILIAVAVLAIWKKNTGINSTRRISLLKNTLATFSVASLLGVTWVFGYLTLLDTDDNTHIIFSSIFCVCGSTQGLQIFIFYTLRDPRFLEKIAAAIRLFNSCKIYVHSQKYWVNRMQHRKAKRHQEKFKHFSDSDELISG